MRRKYFYSVAAVFFILTVFVSHSSGQGKGLVSTEKSQYAKLKPLGLTDVQWTSGFWADWFSVCEKNMVPHMLGMYMNDSISHGYANFEIAAGLKDGKHIGPPFHDGDFYKILEAAIVVLAEKKDQKLEQKIDSIIDVISKTQRADGYIHTPVMIAERKNPELKREFAERMDFETYNMGHLMTAACLHYRLTGKKNLLDIAVKATEFLYNYYKEHAYELAQNAICPSHYMGVTEMYRTLGDPRYLELAKGLIDIRDQVENGHDHNQDRIPFREQTKAQGHAVRANYLYAGAADVYAETGDQSLMKALDAIWHDLVETKMYITGACGALYDGVSPNGTTYDQPSIQQVHQAYGQDFELPNHSAHNESCANIGNLLWNWRMLLATGEARFADVMEDVMYNSLLAGISLDGTKYFYTNPLAVSGELPYDLRWSKDREGYISYCNCCPPNTIRTIAEIANYMYSVSDHALWVHFYGGNSMKTTLTDQSALDLVQETQYPWDGVVNLKIRQAPTTKFSVHVRIPSWCREATVSVNGRQVDQVVFSGKYLALERIWKPGDQISLDLAMPVDFVEANPLVEETRNQVAVRRGPVVYCAESVDIPAGIKLSQVALSSNQKLNPVKMTIGGSEMIGLKGEGLIVDEPWDKRLYRVVSSKKPVKVPVRLVPYYAWDNRGKADMSVWLPLDR